MKIRIFIQSVSDVITNSSSEVFCRIDSNDLEIKNQIYQLLKDLIPGDDSEMEPVVEMYENEIEVFLPLDVDYCGYTKFYRAGIEAILDERFGKENYSIEYEED